MDVVFSGSALIILSPLLLILVLIQLGSSGLPIFFRQQRVGLGGASFTLLKFRTMRIDKPEGPSITARGDRRITPLGRFMRATKVDELPQLLNVLTGKMSIVGPRPELPLYVKLYTDCQKRVLDVRPGLTDPATLRFRNEERLLAKVEPAERETYYIDEIMPKKLELNLVYLERAGLGFDFALIMRTLGAIVLPPRS